MFIKYLSCQNRLSAAARFSPVICGVLSGLSRSILVYLLQKFYIVRNKSTTTLKPCDMDNITKVWTGPLPPDSPYVRPYRFYFVQNGVEKNWDLLKVHDSVSIILFHRTRKTLIFVKQFRPGELHRILLGDTGQVPFMNS